MPIEQLPLIPEPVFEPPANYGLVVELLRQATNIGVISDYLKKKDLTSSAGSWQDLSEKRLIPALRDGAITLENLVELLGEVEEYGHSHTFLYRIEKAAAASLIDRTTVEKIAKSNGLADRLGSGKILNQPSEPTIASIRLENDPRGKSLVIKIVEKRFEHKFLREHTDGNRFSMEWEIVEARAVNVVRLFSFGILEIRVASHTSKKYAEDISRIAKLVRPFLQIEKFNDFSLKKAKVELWSNADKYTDEICFSNTSFRSTDGSTIAAASGVEDGDLFSNSEVKKVAKLLGNIVKAGDAHCEHSSIYWLAREGSLPSTKMHVILPSLRNEFAVPAHCSKADYDHVFDKIREIAV